MASEWFYQTMGKQVGPVSGVELRNLAQAGTVTTETLVANAPSGPWVSAGRVRGLFAVPNGSPPLAAATRTAQVPPPHAAASEESSGLGTATKITLVVGGGMCMLVLGFLVWFIAGRDTWELNNASRVSAKLDEAGRLQQSDFVTAYKIYDEVLKEAKQHKITDEWLAQKLADAEKSRTALYPKVQEKIQAEQRLAEEEVQRSAGSRLHIDGDFVLKILGVVGALAFVGLWVFALTRQGRIEREAAENLRIAKKHLDDQVETELQRLYAEPVGTDEAAIRIIRSLEAIAAKVEIGIDRDFYTQCVANAWAESKQLLESAIYPGFCYFAIGAFDNYRRALEIWRTQGKSVPAFIGGGFGVAGALEGMAVATVLNAVVSAASNVKTQEISSVRL